MAQPLGMVVSADGERLYLASFGTDRIAVYDTAELEEASEAVSASSQITLGAGGPTAVALDDANDRLYAYTRFNDGLSIVDTVSNTEIGSVELSNPEPRHVIDGRSHLYNASSNSSHGDASCASCHVFGDVDGLAWDLGNPDHVVVSNPNRFVNLALSPDERARFHPMKGPMTTQSLRGLSDAGPMHWRGDRTGRNPREGESLEHAAFVEFNEAFVELLGRDAPLSDAEMAAFADFALTIRYPPNPIRALDNSLSASAAEGRRIYFEESTTSEEFTCNDCHRLDPPNGHFGTDGKSFVEGDDIYQEFKVPHLRNAYQNIVGQQITLSATTGPDSDARLDLLLARAAVTSPRPECDLIGHGVVFDRARRFLSRDGGPFQSDDDTESFSVSQLRDLSRQAGGAITFTCVPPGIGAHSLTAK